MTCKHNYCEEQRAVIYGLMVDSRSVGAGTATPRDCSSKMILFNNGCTVAVLLIALTQSLVCSFRNDEKNNLLETMSANGILESLRVPWIDGFGLDIFRPDSPCAEEVGALIEAVKSGQMWALQMLDASSKVQSGILRGNIRDFGMYRECIEARGKYQDIDVQGKHCMVSFVPDSEQTKAEIRQTLSRSFFSSLCVPSSCNESEILQSINAAFENVPIQGIVLQASRVTCERSEAEDFTIGEILTIVLFGLVGVFMVFCTICDIAKRNPARETSAVVNMLAKFSLYKNAIALLSTKVTPKTMPAIQGIRFLSIFWIVLGHHYVASLMRPMVNLTDIQGWMNSWTAVYIQLATFAVDTFFVVSGFLMAYLFLQARQSGKKFSLPMMYIHRYIRLTPCLAVLVLFIAFLLHRVSNGPGWESSLDEFIDHCQKNWWINLLYVQNIVRRDEMCAFHTWYLAVDMQLFLISPIILYPLYRWPKYGLGLLSLFIVASVITPAVVLAVNGYSNAIMRFDQSMEQIADGAFYYYIPSYNRACAYFVGILLGYDLAANKKRLLSKLNVTVNWVLAAFLMLICGWATHRIYNTHYTYDLLLEAVFAVLLRPFWSIAIAWIVYACTQGYGGPVTRFLSLPIFQPLSRLSYCIYLVHLVIQVAKNSSAETSGIFSDFVMVNDFWSDLMLSIPVAFVFSLFFESPVIVLEKILTQSDSAQDPSILAKETETDSEKGMQNEAMTKE